MADKENRRKCFKCGSSPAVDNIKLFRFPKPAVKNILRCTLWAKYLFPAKEQYTLAFQAKLHNEHRMLCEKHFIDGDFTDSSKKTLLRTAVPCDTDKVSLVFPSYFVESQAGPSQIIAAQAQAGSSKNTTLRDISREQPQKSQRISNNIEPEKERCLYEKYRLAVLIKEVLNQCFQAGINISATVCDMDGVNRRALSILGANVQQPYFTLHNKEIVTLFDTPHLLKCFRNLFMKYDIQCRTNISSGTEVGTGVAKWSHIKEFFDVDKNPNFVFAPALTKEHLNPNPKQKMRVKLAAQVLSHTVAAGIYVKIANGALTAEAAVTANVVSNMDKLFDCLNSDTADLRRGKIHATNMTLKSPHMSCFSDMKLFFQTMKFVGCSRQPPSLDGWIWTINGVERLFTNMSKAHNIKSLVTRRLQQDPIENLFGCIRGNCGSNTNPTTGQFAAGLKTSILSSLAHIGTIGSNCERDNNVIINNLSKLLSLPQSTLMHAEPEFHAISELPNVHVIEQNIDKGNAEVQACAYVCGFLLKQLPVNKCKKCRKIFVSNTVDKCHLFVECREYSDFNRSLYYVTKEMINYVDYCASLINSYLRENEHMSSLKKNLAENIRKSINFEFAKECTIHSEQNFSNLTNSVLIICLKRFCIVKNRLFAEEASAAALRRKMNIMLHR
ncbi:unnamed protein product [Parnassius mnemosyne]|uniref:THAP-type domain-containing protein n=1 Tax=Parnassius mnemosyne TaxID=213953 RepID=A0AAV1LQM0_9NEOP